MSKILRIYAKKGSANTSAQDDFLQNLERGLSRPSLFPETAPIEEKPVAEETATPVQEDEVKPFSDPKPTELPVEIEGETLIEREGIVDETMPVDEEPPKEPPEEQFDIPFEQPIVTEPPAPEPVPEPIPVSVEGEYVSAQQFQENSRILTARIESLNIQLLSLSERVKHMALNLEALTEEVTRAKTVQASAVELINKVVAELEAVSVELAARVSEPPIDTSAIDALASELKQSTDSLAAAVADSVDVKPTHKIVLNADNPDKATIEVVLPEVLPEVVEATVEPITDGIDPTSPDPQARVVVEEATDAVAAAVAASSPEVATGVVETAEGEANVTVAVDPAAPVSEVVDTVKEAYDATPEVTAVPVQ